MRRRLLAGVVVLVLAAAIPVAASALRTDPAKSVTISADDARSIVVSFVARPEWTSDLAVTGPNDGAYMRYYDVMGKSAIAAVNASDGSVTTLFLPGNLVVGGHATTSADAALKAAKDFVALHGIAVSGIDQTESQQNHDDSSEWVVSWQAHDGNVTVPKFFEVGVDSSTGVVYRYASVNHTFDKPGQPKIDQATAEDAARKASGLSHVDSVELSVAFTDSGDQYLVYDVALSGAIPGDSSGQMMLHALVQIDATTGEAKITGRG